MKNVNSIFPTVSAYILFGIYFLVWFHQFDCGDDYDNNDDDDDDDDHDDDHNSNNDNNITIKFASVKVQMSLCMSSRRLGE
jgi:hypothetical protein